jgi:transcriptional regulator with XRE-family HTH domain
MPRRNVGDTIKQARLRRGLTQEQLAYSLGVSGVTVSRWERNVQQPRMIDCQKLAKKLSERGRPFLAEDFAA